jgi:hypothetical protein
MSVSPLLLVSSIPPQLRGQPLDASHAASLQQRVFASWRQAGCSLLSLHTSTELAARSGHAEQLRQAGVAVLELQQGDAEPLPNLRASLTALSQAHPQALIVLTNADILFAPSTGLPQVLRDLQPQQALVGRRSNVKAAADGSVAPSGPRDPHGFDFFAFHAEGLRRALPLIPEGLVFGRPWWDLFLPLALLAAGLQLRDPGANLFLHPIHEERWSGEQWLSFGQHADDRFLLLLDQQGCHGFASRWTRQRRRFIRRWPGFTVLRHRFREQRRALLRERRLLPLYLSDVSDAINSLIDAELAT